MLLKKSYILISIIPLLLSACSNNLDNGTEEREEKDFEEKIVEETGIVSLIKEDERVHVLFIPNITEEQIKGKDEKQINKLAQENNGSWYGIEEGDFKVGQKVKVYYDANQNQLDSNPPKRGAEKIEIIEE